MKNNILLTSLLAFMLACGVEVSDEKQVNPEVVIIFENAPGQQRAPKSLMEPKSSAGVVCAGTVEYVDSLYDIVGFTPRALGRDTIMIPTFNGVAELAHAYAGGASSNYFLLKAGDTVLFTYDTISRRPFLHSLTSHENTTLYNIEQTTQGAYLPNGFKHLSLLYSMDYILANSYMHGNAEFLEKDGRDSIARRIYLDFDTVINLYYRHVRLLSNRLDSLNRTNPRFAKFFSDNLIADNANIRAYDKNYQQITKPYYKTGQRKKSNEPVINNSAKDKLFASLSDTLLANIRYRNKLNSISSISYSPDLKAEYARIDTAKNIPPITKQKMLATIYKTMQEGFFEYKSLPATELAKYAVMRGDTLTVSELDANTKRAIKNCDLIVEDFKGNTMNFLDVVKKYKGKKIYLDYWASWCPPCKTQMPLSLKLKAKNPNIAFVYVAVFDEKDKWRKAVAELKLDPENCYFSTNSRSSAYLQSLNVELIPRYMLFSADGSLLSKNAKRPSENPKF